MKTLRIPISELESDEFLNATPTQRATWFCLVRYCQERKKRKVIRDCQRWGDRQWLPLCLVTKEEVWQKCDLWEWNDGDLFVWPQDNPANCFSNNPKVL